jgi:hypothetical protein
MAQDQIFTLTSNDIELIIPIPIALDIDNKMFLCQTFEVNTKLNKKYLRAQLIIINNHVLTSRVADTIHFMEELNLFDFGNSQNKYLSITEYKTTKNLKLIYDGKNDVFISKSKARAICKMYNMSYMGYSIAAMLENEYKFTPQTLTKLLHHYKLFLK